MAESLRELVTSNKKLEKLVTSNKLTSLEIQERALFYGQGLTLTEVGNDLTGWYCKAFKTLGEGRYKMCADAARKGNKPASLFGWLLKREMEKRNGY